VTLSSTSESLQPVACECGHLKTVHFGDGGTCLGAYRNPQTKKEADATVCPCSTFKEKST
jgi:hypothetical protein